MIPIDKSHYFGYGAKTYFPINQNPSDVYRRNIIRKHAVEYEDIQTNGNLIQKHIDEEDAHKENKIINQIDTVLQSFYDIGKVSRVIKNINNYHSLSYEELEKLYKNLTKVKNSDLIFMRNTNNYIFYVLQIELTQNAVENLLHTKGLVDNFYIINDQPGKKEHNTIALIAYDKSKTDAQKIIDTLPVDNIHTFQQLHPQGVFRLGKMAKNMSISNVLDIINDHITEPITVTIPARTKQPTRMDNYILSQLKDTKRKQDIFRARQMAILRQQQRKLIENQTIRLTDRQRNNQFNKKYIQKQFGGNNDSEKQLKEHLENQNKKKFSKPKSFVLTNANNIMKDFLSNKKIKTDEYLTNLKEKQKKKDSEKNALDPNFVNKKTTFINSMQLSDDVKNFIIGQVTNFNTTQSSSGGGHSTHNNRTDTYYKHKYRKYKKKIISLNCML